jgi:hypothetical protein
MTDKSGQGQADKRAAEERTAQVAAERQQADQPAGQGQPRSAAEKAQQVPRAGSADDPYPAYELMMLEDLRALATERGVEINRDVERAHLITELRAADSGTLSAASRRSAR